MSWGSTTSSSSSPSNSCYDALNLHLSICSVYSWFSYVIYALQCTFVYEKLKHFLGRGVASPQIPPTGRGEPPPQTPPPQRLRRLNFRAFGAHAICSPSKHENQTPRMMKGLLYMVTRFHYFHSHALPSNGRANENVTKRVLLAN